MIVDKPLMDPAQVAASATTYYTVPTGVRTKITKLVFCNPSSVVAYTVSVWAVPSGGSAGDSTAIVVNKTLQALETYESYEVEGLTLEPGATLRAAASSASAITMHMSGLEMS
jgi:hypothetical protein